MWLIDSNLKLSSWNIFRLNKETTWFIFIEMVNIIYSTEMKTSWNISVRIRAYKKCNVYIRMYVVYSQHMLHTMLGDNDHTLVCGHVHNVLVTTKFCICVMYTWCNVIIVACWSQQKLKFKTSSTYDEVLRLVYTVLWGWRLGIEVGHYQIIRGSVTVFIIVKYACRLVCGSNYEENLFNKNLKIKVLINFLLNGLTLNWAYFLFLDKTYESIRVPFAVDLKEYIF